MIQVVCDNCSYVLRNSDDSTGAEPEISATLKLSISKGENGVVPLHMDLCLKCAKKYLAVLKDPV